MFGYIKPKVNELLVKEYEFYRGTYCGVCRSMKKCTGYFSNALHTYDSVFMALCRMLFIDKSQISARKGRCALHPIKPRPMLNRNDATDYTARAFAILTYYKLLDDISDEKLLRKMARSLLRPIFAGAKSKAGLNSLADMTGRKLAEITRMEKERLPSVDEPARLFGEILGEMFSFELSGADKTVMYYIGYHTGKFIYSADAAEDYDKDRKSGSYNPYVEIYGGADLTDENRSTVKCALLLELKELENAVNLLPSTGLYTIEGIIKNIIYLGMPDRISFLDGKGEKSEDKK